MAIIKCPECGHQISEQATVCPICGIGIAGNVVRCSHCGEVYLRSDGLCPNCHRPTRSFVFDDNEVEQEESPVEEKTTDTAKEIKEETIVEQTAEETSVEVVDKQTKVSPVASQSTSSEETIEEELEEESEEETYVETPITEDIVKDTPLKNPIPVTDSEIGYIGDDDEDEEEEKETETLPEESSKDKPNDGHRGYMPIAVSLAITALIAAVCFYFYNDSKMSKESQALNAAIESNDVGAIYDFLRRYPDASTSHKDLANQKINEIQKREKDEALSLTSRDKATLQKFLAEYPSTPRKAQILQTIDSIDWEDAVRMNSKEGYEKYIAEHSDGLFIKEAKEKVSVKTLAATEADRSMAYNLFRGFFLGVNRKDGGTLKSSMGAKISSFMGKESASGDDVVAWMNKQYEDGVQSITWKLDHNYDISKKEQNDTKEYTIGFTGHRTSIQKDGRSVTEHYKVNAKVNESGKITSMNMEKYTPKAGESSGSSSSTSSGSKPAASSPKPASGGSSSTKPASGSTSKPASGGASKPASGSASKPASGTSKPASGTSKPASGTSKPASGTSKPASGSAKPASGSAKPASSGKSSTTPPKK